MAVLIAIAVAALAIFITMIAIIFGSGTIEGRKRPEEQDRPYGTE